MPLMFNVAKFCRNTKIYLLKDLSKRYDDLKIKIKIKIWNMIDPKEYIHKPFTTYWGSTKNNTTIVIKLINWRLNNNFSFFKTFNTFDNGDIDILNKVKIAIIKKYLFQNSSSIPIIFNQYESMIDNKKI